MPEQLIPSVPTEEIAVWLEQVGIRSGQRVLDVGCGRGRFAIPAARIVEPDGLVLAVDLDLKKLRSLSPRRTGTLLAAAADGRNLPTSTASFDAAVLGFVLHELQEPYPLLNEVRRALREEGTLTVFEWTASVRTDSPSSRRLAPDEVERLFDSTGFRVENVSLLSDSVYAVRGTMAKVRCCGAYSPVLL